MSDEIYRAIQMALFSHDGDDRYRDFMHELMEQATWWADHDGQRALSVTEAVDEFTLFALRYMVQAFATSRARGIAPPEV
jgi:hypothetical protein